ncbi:MAG: hypothetical protein AB2588_17400 [Candidatus Thiodiazotropha sp.]
MTTQSKGAGGFGLKVIFWLVIIILAFMYIRSLAKNPQAEDTASTSAVKQEVVESASTAPATAAEEGAAEQSATAQDDAETAAEAAAEAGAGSAASVSEVEQQAPMVSAPAVDEEQAAAATETASGSDQSSGQTTAAAGAETTADAAQGAAPAAGDQQVPQSIRDLHAESVSKILKEFDELRDAARAEMEAMRNLMQAERELQEAMASPPPRPAWPGRGYTPYGGYPPSQQGYTPYYPR